MHSHNKPHLRSPEHYTAFVSPAFRIGDNENTQEIMRSGSRYLLWIPNGNETFAEEAGWGKLVHGEEDGIGYLEIPSGTRSASSVLSGMEAWRGEKAGILERIVEYAQETRRNRGAVDVGVGLDTLAVTREHDTFFTPPHLPETDPEVLSAWVSRVVNDAELVLEKEPEREPLIDTFQKQLHEILKDRP